MINKFLNLEKIRNIIDEIMFYLFKDVPFIRLVIKDIESLAKLFNDQEQQIQDLQYVQEKIITYLKEVDQNNFLSDQINQKVKNDQYN